VLVTFARVGIAKGETMISAHSQIESMSKQLISQMLIVVVCICLSGSQAVADENPLGVVKTGTDNVIKILKQYPEDTQARREKIRGVVDQYFDYGGVSRLALGPQWNKQPPEKQQEFERDFSRLLFGKYIDSIEKYANQKITYNQEQVTQDHVVVESTVMDRGGPVHIDYALHLKNGKWGVYDVSVEGLSLVVNYRSQFDQMLASGTFDNVLAKLKQQVAQVCGSKPC
jgi:phospholipid transport system substrate-binding protein